MRSKVKQSKAKRHRAVEGEGGKCDVAELSLVSLGGEEKDSSRLNRIMGRGPGWCLKRNRDDGCLLDSNITQYYASHSQECSKRCRSWSLPVPTLTSKILEALRGRYGLPVLNGLSGCPGAGRCYHKERASCFLSS